MHDKILKKCVQEHDTSTNIIPPPSLLSIAISSSYISVTITPLDYCRSRAGLIFPLLALLFVLPYDSLSFRHSISPNPPTPQHDTLFT